METSFKLCATQAQINYLCDNYSVKYFKKKDKDNPLYTSPIFLWEVVLRNVLRSECVRPGDYLP